MSLFDVIKYPISDPPTYTELTALPYDIWIKWVVQCGWQKNIARHTIVNYYAYVAIGDPRKEIYLLRKIIEEYDEPV